MKNIFKSTFAVLLCVIIAVAFSVSAFADGTVTYEGNSQKFIFAPGSEKSPTDLFDGFKDVMPGDKLTQKITVNNKASDKVKVKIYLKSTGSEKGYEDFLSKLNLTVKQNGSSKLFDAPADKSGDLSNWVALGTVYSGGKIDLDLTLDVPADLGNEYMDTFGILDWQFKIEELPIEKDDPSPVTGDFSNLIPYITVLLIAVVLGTFILLLVLKRKRAEEQ